MEEQDRATTRDRMIVEALLDRRMELEEERHRLDGEMVKLRGESERLARELEILEEMLGTTRPEQKVTFAAPPAPTFAAPAPSAPTVSTPRPRAAAHVKFRKGSVGSKLWPLIQDHYSAVEFGVEEVCNLLKDQSPETKHPYEASWRLCNELIERKVFLVTSQSKSGRGFAKRFRIADPYALPPPPEAKGVGLLS